MFDADFEGVTELGTERVIVRETPFSLMYGHGMIGDDDVDEYGEGLRETVRESLSTPFDEQSNKR